MTDRIASIHRSQSWRHCGDIRLRTTEDVWMDCYGVITVGSLSLYSSACDLYDDGDPTAEVVLANVLVVESSSELDADSVFDVHARVKTGGNADGMKIFTLDAGSAEHARRWMEQLCQAVGVLELLPAEGGGYVSVLSETAVARRAEQRRLSAMKLLGATSSPFVAADAWSPPRMPLPSQEDTSWPSSSSSSSSSRSVIGKSDAERRPSTRNFPFTPGRGGGRGRGRVFVGAEPGAIHVQPPAAAYSVKLNPSDSPPSSSGSTSVGGSEKSAKSSHRLRPDDRDGGGDGDGDGDENGEEKANHVFSSALQEEVQYDESRSAARAMKMLSLGQGRPSLVKQRGGSGRGRGLLAPPPPPLPPPPLPAPAPLSHMSPKALSHVPI